MLGIPALSYVQGQFYIVNMNMLNEGVYIIVMTPSLVYPILAHTLCSPAGIPGPIGKPSVGQGQ